MLTELLIKNVAIIDQLRIRFGPGLTVLSGETGAGKSIIIDALSLLCGGRAAQELIRTGTDEAQVEGIFDVTPLPELQRWLEEAGFDAGEELVVKRRLSRVGPNRIYLNGSAATLSQLRELGEQLITIHGQHESQGLLRPDVHLELLDRYANCGELRNQYQQRYNHWQDTERSITALSQAVSDRETRLEIVSYQIDELVSAALVPDEDQLIDEEYRRLASAERLVAAAQGGFEQLYGGDRTVLRDVGRIKQSLQELASLDPALAPIVGQLEEGYLQLEDAALALRDYAGHIDCDPDVLKQLEERRDLVNRLVRKYGKTVAEVLERLAALQEEQATLLRAESDQGSLMAERDQLREQLEQDASRLHHARVAAGERLAAQATAEIRELSLPHGAFQVLIESLDSLRSDGSDRVEFLFTANPGEPPRPLGRVASGGELSRLMLALKQVLPEGEAPILVFDEVDTGVSGAVAAVIGRKLAGVAVGQQLFCVTHLPQVAAWGDQHLVVRKTVADGRTVTVVEPLDEAGRITELARLLAGEQIGDSALTHARAMRAESHRG